MRRPNAEDVRYAEMWGVSPRTIVKYGLERLLAMQESPRRLVLKQLSLSGKTGLTVRGIKPTSKYAPHGLVEDAIQGALRERWLIKPQAPKNLPFEAFISEEELDVLSTE